MTGLRRRAVERQIRCAHYRLVFYAQMPPPSRRQGHIPRYQESGCQRIVELSPQAYPSTFHIESRSGMGKETDEDVVIARFYRAEPIADVRESIAVRAVGVKLY